MTALTLRTLVLLSGIFLLAGAGAARAVEVTGLYDALVPVANQGAAERIRATTEGFRQVLVKASGQRTVLTSPAIQQELGKAESLLGSFRYETVSPGRAAGSADSASAAPSSLRLRLTFDPASVRGILNRAGAPVWSSNRPQVALWIMREGASRVLFSAGTAQADALLDAAFMRGLSVSLPAPGDTLPQDSNGVPIPFRDTSGRVDARVVLAAALTVSGTRTRVLGTLLVEGAEQRLDASANDEAEALREVVAQAADLLGARYGVVARQDKVSTVRLRVQQVSTLASYAALERWLMSQPLLKDVVLVRLEDDVANFTLAMAGDIERLLQAMRADGRFAAIDSPAVEGSIITLSATLALPSTP